MHHVAIDVDEAGAVLLLVHDVILHDLVIHGLARGDDPGGSSLGASHGGGAASGLGGDRGAARESPRAVEGGGAGGGGRGGGHHGCLFCWRKDERDASVVLTTTDVLTPPILMVMKAQKKNIHLKPETYFPIRIFDRFRALPQGPSCLESGGERERREIVFIKPSNAPTHNCLARGPRSRDVL